MRLKPYSPSSTAHAVVVVFFFPPCKNNRQWAWEQGYSIVVSNTSGGLDTAVYREAKKTKTVMLERDC